MSGIANLSVFASEKIRCEQRKWLDLTPAEAQKVIEEVSELIGFGPGSWDMVSPVYLVQVIARKAHGIRSTGGEHE